MGVFFLVISLREEEKNRCSLFEMIPELKDGLLNGSRVKLEADAVKPENNFLHEEIFQII